MTPRTAQVLFKVLLEAGKTLINILESKPINGRKENDHAPEKREDPKT